MAASAEAAETSLRTLEPEAEKARLEEAQANAELESVLSKPDRRFDQAKGEAEALLAAAAALYQDATKGRSLAEAGINLVTTNKSEFIEARNHHRSQASSSFWLMAAAAVMFAGIVVALFFPWGFVTAPRGVMMGASNPAPNDWWVPLVLLLGGRLSLLAGAAWLVVFLGRLHSRHSQQSVSYQDRVAGLDAAQVIIQYGTVGSREEALKQMTATYLRLDANAFQAPPGPQDTSLRDLRRLLKSTLDPIASVPSSAPKK